MRQDIVKVKDRFQMHIWLYCTDTSKWKTYHVVSYLMLHFLCVKSVTLSIYCMSLSYLGIIDIWFNVSKRGALPRSLFPSHLLTFLLTRSHWWSTYLQGAVDIFTVWKFMSLCSLTKDEMDLFLTFLPPLVN